LYATPERAQAPTSLGRHRGHTYAGRNREAEVDMAQYGYSRQVECSVDEAQKRIEAELAVEGFGVLTRIALHEKLKEKLGVDVPPYIILGACNPPFAKRSLDIEKELGLFLPCNVVVYEDHGKTHVATVRPTQMMRVVENPALDTIAAEVEAKLKRALDQV
jgi:uncharacterized protein (DUF302 family)